MVSLKFLVMAAFLVVSQAGKPPKCPQGETTPAPTKCPPTEPPEPTKCPPTETPEPPKCPTDAITTPTTVTTTPGTTVTTTPGTTVTTTPGTTVTTTPGTTVTTTPGTTVSTTITTTVADIPVTPAPPFKCPKPHGKYPHEYSCILYYHCLFDKPKLMKCSKDKFYSKAEGKCVEDPSVCEIVWRGTGCTEIGLFPVPNSCTEYYTCKAELNGEFSRKKWSCLSNEYFNAELEKCVPGDCPGQIEDSDE